MYHSVNIAASVEGSPIPMPIPSAILSLSLYPPRELCVGLGVEGVVPEEVEELVLEFWVSVGCIEDREVGEVVGESGDCDVVVRT